ncbi:N-acetylglucosamine-6-phosphate deacetylase [Bacillus safensis]|uniref:N-acetylglucosamine-6-phosphate deacetylase n=1 Tax=Bacillus safensis TaxID=561879 RepID=UPI000B442DE5|nr:N-acetylglucosamine-6-phosphate deacetylase [Bacillus safensis]MCY7492766.1 N-acetylglucosamine-6-phosphate deacetylase [Bacillus safensis]MED4994686.1 N-acetylglucosamine-6-phosphate deacetylase [Bacillus safensis]UDB49175.1 N-acetylglucosamine-6-phosphate deacetylase [Bacillus safensis]
MSGSLLLSNIHIVTKTKVIENGFVGLRDGKIDYISTSPPTGNYEKVYISRENFYLLPGMIDIHIHGGYGADMMDATEEAMNTLADNLPSEGTTSFLATTITQNHHEIEQALKNVAQWKQSNEAQAGNQAQCIGIHLEGPFISKDKAGAQPVQWIKQPDIPLFKKWLDASDQLIRIVTFAPEEDTDFAFLSLLQEKNIIPSIGHTNAHHDMINLAAKHGARHVTHLYNAISSFQHREPNAVGAALTNENLHTELITDGIHSHPLSIKLAYLAKGSDRLIMITDSMRAKGLGNGTYEFGGQTVTVSGEKALLDDGTLAGSILRMKDGVKRMKQLTDCDWTEIAKMTSTNAAAQLGLDQQLGSIEVGKLADLVIWDESGELMMTICRGQIVFEKKEANH